MSPLIAILALGCSSELRPEQLVRIEDGCEGTVSFSRPIHHELDPQRFQLVSASGTSMLGDFDILPDPQMTTTVFTPNHDGCEPHTRLFGQATLIADDVEMDGFGFSVRLRDLDSEPYRWRGNDPIEIEQTVVFTFDHSVGAEGTYSFIVPLDVVLLEEGTITMQP